MKDDPPDISKLDEIINEELSKNPTRNGFKQAVSLEKQSIDNPFYCWFEANVEILLKWSILGKIEDDSQEEHQPKKAKRSINVGNGTSLSEEEFFEENDWIDTDEPGAFQEEVEEVYEEFREKPIDFRSTFQPIYPSMRLF